ncbi:MAG: hypothetical protein AB7F59_08425 [Bdellovibrionales bacterium]
MGIRFLFIIALTTGTVIPAHANWLNPFSFFTSKAFTTLYEQPIEGRIVRYPQDFDVYIQLNDTPNILPIRSPYRESQADLEHLEAGDWISGRGFIADGYVRLESLELIGIRKILGKWNELSDRSVFHFQDFNSLSVEYLSNNNKSIERFKYRLAPDKKDEWTVFLSEPTGVHLGSIQYLQNKMLFHLIDVSTGKIVQTFDLSALKFPVRR